MVNSETWKKVGMTIFLLLIIVGFTIPAFLNNNSSNTVKTAEPRLCQTDADCYLTCDDTPVAVLCTQNLCLQNACEEYSVYPLEQQGTSFHLEVKINTTTVDLSARSKPQNFFVTFTGNQVQMFSSGLTLNHVLDKVNLQLNEQCLYLDAVSYCSDAKQEVHVLVNGNQTFDYGAYVPKEGDNIQILY